MRLKGLEVFREKLPWYSGKRMYILLVITIITVFISLSFQIFMFIIPYFLETNQYSQILSTFISILTSGLVLTLGFLFVYIFWHLKHRLLKNNKDKAYQKAFPIGLVGITLVISYVIHSILPYSFIFINRIEDQLIWYFTVPVNEIFFNSPLYLIITRIIISLFFIFIGFTVIFKSLFFFGIDNMALVYVYYPEESKIVHHEIYSVLRHPTYHGLVIILVGNIALKLSFYSFILFLLFLIGIKMHLKFVEEKELIQRFGKNYEEYRSEVPALFVRIKDIKKYFSFLFRLNS
jgi:protein-S-isoprenylcysteine O-methyltransferase Ste14